MNWKYANLQKTIVLRILDSGGVESCLASTLDPVTDFPVLDPDPLTAAEVIESYTVLIQKRLDTFARTRGYDDIKSASEFAGDEDPQFNLEGTYAKLVRSRTWRTGYNIMGQVQLGLRPLPTWDELAVLLPPLVWPA